MVVVSSATAEWKYRGFHWGMSFESFLKQANKLGYDTDHCKNSSACTLLRTHDSTDMLTFSFCEKDQTVYEIDISLEGRTLTTFADALEDVKTTYGVSVADAVTWQHSSEIEGQPVTVTWLTINLSSAETLGHGWYIKVQVNGFAPNLRYSNLNTHMGFYSFCN